MHCELLFRPVSENNWTLVYNGSETEWEVTDLTWDEGYLFKVKASNQIGWGWYSDNSTVFLYPMHSSGRWPHTRLIRLLTHQCGLELVLINFNLKITCVFIH